jgi:23S rRNA (cytosine1962-C5)-methyltransferase
MERPSDFLNKSISHLLNSAFERRSLLFKNPDTDCFRIFHSAGDGVDGLTIDFYSGYILLQFFNLPAKEMIKKILPDLIKTIPVPLKGILCKNRMAPSRDEIPDEQWKSTILEGEYPSDGIIVIQNGVKARADLVNGQNTGIFLDMREIRDKLSSFYKAESVSRMLNLFSYTALFSVHALKNGVGTAVNIDLSRGVLNRAKANYQLNDLKVDERDFIYGDAVEWTKLLNKKKVFFDYAVFDPPTFARNKKKNFSVKKDYSDSLQRVELLIHKGFILSSVNSYTVSEQEYRSFHPSGWELLMFGNESSDFVYSGNPYLKVGLWKI